MPIIDEEGDLFGVANAVDVFAIVVVLLLVAAGGVVYVSGQDAGEDDILTQTVTVRTVGSNPGVANLSTGSIRNADVVAVRNVETVDRSGANTTWRVDVQLRIGVSDNGLPQFRGERLYIGRTLTLELNEVTVKGVVVDAAEPEHIPSMPTVTTTTTTTTPTTTTTKGSTTTTSTTTTTTTTQTTPEPETRTIHLETRVDPGIAEELSAGPVAADAVVRITDVTVVAETESSTTLDIALEIEVTESESLVYFRGVALSEGDRLQLDLGPATVEGTVTDVSD